MRRARLYYLRGLSGKKARLHSKVRDLSGLISDEERDALEAAANPAPAVAEVEPAADPQAATVAVDAIEDAPEAAETADAEAKTVAVDAIPDSDADAEAKTVAVDAIPGEDAEAKTVAVDAIPDDPKS